MEEYKIKFKVTYYGYIFKNAVEGVDMVKAKSAKEALEKWREEYSREILLVKMSNCSLQVVDVLKI